MSGMPYILLLLLTTTELLREQGNTNFRYQVAMATTFFTASPAILGSSVLNLLPCHPSSD
jgi:hypothetical protein